jgi:hypothetical protein
MCQMVFWFRGAKVISVHAWRAILTNLLPRRLILIRLIENRIIEYQDVTNRKCLPRTHYTFTKVIKCAVKIRVGIIFQYIFERNHRGNEPRTLM